MNVPFVAIDTRTGFHLASNGLELTGAQTKSKSALAVLCNSIMLLWSNVATTEACEADKGSSRSFVVDIATGSETTDSVRYFHSNGRFLCVVFAAERHALYAAFAERLAQCLIDDGPKALKNRCTVKSIAQEALKAAFTELCAKEGLVECVSVSKSSTASFVCSHGELDAFAADLYHSFDTVSVPGMYACGTLMHAVHQQGEARCVVAAYDAQLASFEKIATDSLLVRCCLSVCAALE